MRINQPPLRIVHEYMGTIGGASGGLAGACLKWVKRRQNTTP
jgi:hypothetical protein